MGALTLPGPEEPGSVPPAQLLPVRPARGQKGLTQPGAGGRSQTPDSPPRGPGALQGIDTPAPTPTPQPTLFQGGGHSAP